MIKKIKTYIKTNSFLMELIYSSVWCFLKVLCVVIPIKKKSLLFVSFGGRNYDDSPRDLYEYIQTREEFNGWKFYWGIKDTTKVDIPNAEIIKFGSFKYWIKLLTSQIWIGNGGIDCGLDITKKGCIIINTWHGTPIKKIQGEENSNKVLSFFRTHKPIDKQTIRCCQSDYDKEIFSRVFRADRCCFVMSGLPRNDKLLEYTENDVLRVKESLNIIAGKKVILYMPTYREYMINSEDEIYLKPPMDLKKWELELSKDYVLLIRAHYAVSASLGIKDGSFIKDVSKYAPLSDLYAIADILISDYSSAFFDYSIYGRPMRCFAYDLERYEKERGFYLNLEQELPCPIHKNEDELLASIKRIDYNADCEATKSFAKKYIPNEGMARKTLTDIIVSKINSIK